MKHLTENNLTYFGHMSKAFSHIISCQKVSFKLLVHALFHFYLGRYRLERFW